MLVGRDREQGMVRALVAGARVGQGSALVLLGEAGIGKSALLDDAAASATGMRVLRATGTENESEVAFGALHQLLRPALVHLQRIPPPQGDALAAALALRPGPAGDRFAIGAATLSLLSRLAEDRPLAVLVDDAHLMDRASAQALTFAARRLTADPVVVLAAVRPGWSCALVDADLPVLHLAGISLVAACDLLGASGRRMADEAVTRLHRATAGNPLGLLELADDALLSAAPEGVPLPVSSSLVRAFAARADRLSAPAGTALLVAAAGGDDMTVVASACRRLGGDVTALTEAEDLGLLALDAGSITFRHPLVRSAVYSRASPAARRAVHRALAETLPGADVERRAWHLGEAATGPDEDTATTLVAAGRRAQERGAHAVAAVTLERAARLSPDPDDRAERLVTAAESAWLAGTGEHAVALLDAADAPGLPSRLRARASGLRGRVAARTGSVEEARDVLVGAGTAQLELSPDTAVELLADAVLTCFLLVDTPTVLRTSAAIDQALQGTLSPRSRLLGRLATGVAGVLTGRGGPAQIRSCLQHVVPDDLLHDLRLAPWLVIGPLFLRESDTGRDLVQQVVDSLRERSAVGGLPFLLFSVARDQATSDRWEAAEVTYSEGIRLAREVDHSTDLAVCLAGLAWLEARQGREVECREHAREAVELGRLRRTTLVLVWALHALGELELGLGRPAEAIGHLRQLDALLAQIGFVDVDVSPAPELVDALLRTGEVDEAAEVAERYAEAAAAKGQPWALARAGRALALTRPDGELDGHVGRALEHHAQTVDSFELARTQLAYGSRLRRARRRADAREPLRAALTTFDALGAAPWAEQAAVELLATGETARRRGSSPVDSLTPQERQVAQLLAGGRTTREAATALFLSPKTVEYHLRHVYLKLGISSRAELAEGLSQSLDGGH